MFTNKYFNTNVSLRLDVFQSLKHLKYYLKRSYTDYSSKIIVQEANIKQTLIPMKSKYGKPIQNKQMQT